jgi:hypothetical protein
LGTSLIETTPGSAPVASIYVQPGVVGLAFSQTKSNPGPNETFSNADIQATAGNTTLQIVPFVPKGPKLTKHRLSWRILDR